MFSTPGYIVFYYFTFDGYRRMQQLMAWAHSREGLGLVDVIPDEVNFHYGSVVTMALSIGWWVHDKSERYFFEVCRGEPDSSFRVRDIFF
ncbi:MAG: hypothetical protein JRH20_22680 [Deltaproteobacteria bacterium]|nr:hypothetical protein [Deltaproteobacteria bacterium]